MGNELIERWQAYLAQWEDTPADNSIVVDNQDEESPTVGDLRALLSIARGGGEAVQSALATQSVALLRCRDVFLHYEELHQAKGTADGNVKAARNREMADVCSAALDKTVDVQIAHSNTVGEDRG